LSSGKGSKESIPMNGGYFFNSGILFKIAVSAYERTKSALSDSTDGQNDALVAILFSAAALEASIMDLALIAAGDSQIFGRTDLQALADILDETESSRGSIRLKFLLAKSILSGKPYEKGSLPYQDFDTLFTLRDAIIHMKPEKITGEPHKIIQRLQAKNLCEPQDPHLTGSWLGQVSTRAVARWACNVVVDMVQSLHGYLRGDGTVTPSISSFMSSRFTRVT
jgi:hypothetical protein